MQYILTQEEFDQLKSDQEQRLAVDLGKLQRLCTKICNEMPVEWGWGGDPKPWGCMLTKENEFDEEWCCDRCPVATICPCVDKRWSQ